MQKLERNLFMKIKKYSSEQFAGMRNQEIQFEDGMNVIFGKNEAGKSTMLAAIFHVLLTSSKLDKRKNRDFIEHFFSTSGARTIDAAVMIQCEDGNREKNNEWNTERENEWENERDNDKENEELNALKGKDKKQKNKQRNKKENLEEDGKGEGKTYIVEKIWDIDGKENITKIKEEGGDIWRGIQAEEMLSKLLEYGIAFYRNLVFDNQSHEEETLQWFYEFFSSEGKVDDDITEIKMKLSEAFSVVGGISEEKFLSLLDEKMRRLSGKWDFVKDAPEKGRGIDNKWKRECGEILLSYYEYKEAKREWEESVKVEEELEKKTKELKFITLEKSNLEEERARLESQRAEIFNKSKTEKLLKNIKLEWKECQKTLKDWPEKEEEIKVGKALERRRQTMRLAEEMQQLEEKLETAKNFFEKEKQLSKSQKEYEKLSDDFEKAKEAEKNMQKNQLQLSSVKLLTEICLEKPHDFKIEDASGESHLLGRDFLTSEKMDVDGFVKISIPGIAKIQVSPKNLDVEKCQEEMKKNQKILNEMLKKYRVEMVSELSEKKRNLQEKLVEKRSIEREIERVLEGKTVDEWKEELVVLEKKWEQLSYLKEENEKTKEPLKKGRESSKKTRENLEKEKKNLNEEIDAFLEKTKKMTLDASIAAAETILWQYENTYKTYESLLQTKEMLKKEECEYERQLKNLENISITEEEYKQKMELFEKKLKQMNQDRDELSGQIGSLSLREDMDIAEAEQDVYRLEEEWKRKKKMYYNYKRIREDFISLKRESKDKFEEFYKSFCENLAIITGNRIEVTSFHGLELWSEKNQITSKEILSKGTKRTVLLAFRLAILKYFYRNEEGGVVFLDDILLDMDQERRENSAKLLREFARKNQVIFTTCDEQIVDLLGGNLIQI